MWNIASPLSVYSLLFIQLNLQELFLSFTHSGLGDLSLVLIAQYYCLCVYLPYATRSTLRTGLELELKPAFEVQSSVI